MSNILTLERFRGMKMLSSCSDDILSHKSNIQFAAGFIMVIFGLMSFALGISAICTSASASYTGYGLWCGIMFTVTGFIFMSTLCSRSACLITTALVFALLSLTLGAIQFSLAIKAAKVDNERTRFELMWSPYNYVYDVFKTRNVFYGQYCSGRTDFNFSNAWGAVDILLVICGFIEMVCSLMGVILTTISLFCGVRRFKNYQEGIQRGYMNSAYDNHSNAPPIYKINEF